MLAQEGLFIRIGRGVHLESPIQIVNIFNSPTPLMGVRRVLVVAEENSKAAIFFCDHTQTADVKFLSSEIIEVAGEQSSELDIYSIEETTALTSRYSRLFANQENGATIRVGTATLHCGVTRNDFTINLKGERSAGFLSGLAIADRQMHVDNCSNVNHLAPHCDSDQLFKYLLDHNAQGAFEGGIYVDPKAPFTTGYQNNRNIVASPDARMHTEPRLLIYNDEVKCSHGTATGQLDANALFYMQARGIPRETARRMLMIAFMTDTLDTIKVEGIKSRLMMLVEKRLGGEQVLCNDCHADCHPNISTPTE
ncbi:MAG: SufD family Fe-S cluster assembly protein [Muribaculaceae bacterium]|nr:SufD family Fe-S cluster assembly protein [Muribaculaceae bacterium]